jgi:Fe-S-cluster containining protein
MKEIQRLKETILKEYPRLSTDSSFSFSCHRNLECFNECCGDVNIFLTPYDIVRLKNGLGIGSEEFLANYTISPFDENLKYPVVMLKMNDDEKKTCRFVTEEGCRVYADRPWACRMYPLGLASSKEDSESLNDEFFFLLQEGVCKGFKEKKQWTVDEWIKDQGINDYQEFGELFKEITLHEYMQRHEGLAPDKIDMFFTAAYNIDKFRSFVFDSTFLDKFEIDDDTIAKIKGDDVELLRFAFKWLRFALFHEPVIKIRDHVAESKRQAVEEELKKRAQKP